VESVDTFQTPEMKSSALLTKKVNRHINKLNRSVRSIEQSWIWSFGISHIMRDARHPKSQASPDLHIPCLDVKCDRTHEKSKIAPLLTFPCSYFQIECESTPMPSHRIFRLMGNIGFRLLSFDVIMPNNLVGIVW
jgi:hypothetical protein